MRLLLRLIACTLVCSACAAAPIEPTDADLGEGGERVGGAEEPFTCDALSGLGVEHSACAIHCWILGKKGGYCNDQAVCYCRD